MESILSHSAQLSYMLRAAGISSRLPDRFLRFHSSKCTVAFLSRNVSILHTLTPVSDFSDEQRETNIQLLLQVELGFPNGNGRHRYKSRLVKWLRPLALGGELLGMEMVVTGTSCA